MDRRRIVLLLAPLWVWLSLPVQAQSLAGRSALIVGVSQYASAEVPALAGVPVDMVSARTMARAMGIPEQRITVLRDAQATKAAVMRALENLAATMAPGGRAFVYFSGHGTRWYDPSVQGCKEGLLTYDSQTVTNEEIAQKTRRMSEVADKVVVLFDACHSDGVAGKTGKTRSLGASTLTPKFFLKGGQGQEACHQAVNLKTRGLLMEATRWGALQENFVQITSSRADEVSFDEPGKGGLATQGVRDCLLAPHADRDGSGSVSIEEIQQCAQRIVNEKLKPFPDILPHHVTVSGNRNIVPVALTQATAVAQASTPSPTPSPSPARPPAPAPVPVAIPAPPAVNPPPAAPPALPAPPAPAPAPTPSPGPVGTTPAPAAPPPAPALPPAPAPSPSPAPSPTPVAPVAPPPAPVLPAPPPVAPALASLATLKDIESQANPKRRIEAVLSKAALKIGQDPLELTVKSSHAGYVYLIMLGSDAKSFYVLFPNGLDRNNRIAAQQALKIPRPDWQLKAQGPAGTNHLLVVVADGERDLKALTASPPTAAAPFTFSLNNLPGRSALFEFIAGQGVKGASETFGARLLQIKEIP